MLNDNIKSLITATIALYNSEKITQNIIEEGLLKLKEAVKLIKEQQEVTPIEKMTTPVTLEELKTKFPIEPEYPELQLREDYDLETIKKIIENGKIYYVVCNHKTTKDKDNEYVVTTFWNTVQGKDNLMS